MTVTMTESELKVKLAAVEAHSLGRHEGTNEFASFCPTCQQERAQRERLTEGTVVRHRTGVGLRTSEETGHGVVTASSAGRIAVHWPNAARAIQEGSLGATRASRPGPIDTVHQSSDCLIAVDPAELDQG